MEEIHKEQNELKINSLIKTYLTTIHKWAKFFTVLGSVGIGLMFIIGLIMVITGIASNSMGTSLGFEGFTFSIMGIIYVIIAIIYILPVIFLNKFSNSLKNAIEYTNNNELQTAFQNLKSLFKFCGICTIVFISVYILIILIALIAGIIAGFSYF